MDPKFLERAFYALVCLLVGAFGFLVTREWSPPQTQPSVPSLIAPAFPGPACPGTCNPDKVRRGPFRTVCPSCRRLISVQEPLLGDITTLPPADPKP